MRRCATRAGRPTTASADIERRIWETPNVSKRLAFERLARAADEVAEPRVDGDGLAERRAAQGRHGGRRSVSGRSARGRQTARPTATGDEASTLATASTAATVSRDRAIERGRRRREARPRRTSPPKRPMTEEERGSLRLDADDESRAAARAAPGAEDERSGAGRAGEDRLVDLADRERLGYRRRPSASAIRRRATLDCHPALPCGGATGARCATFTPRVWCSSRSPSAAIRRSHGPLVRSAVRRGLRGSLREASRARACVGMPSRAPGAGRRQGRGGDRAPGGRFEVEAGSETGGQRAVERVARADRIDRRDGRRRRGRAASRPRATTTAPASPSVTIDRPPDARRPRSCARGGSRPRSPAARRRRRRGRSGERPSATSAASSPRFGVRMSARPKTDRSSPPAGAGLRIVVAPARRAGARGRPARSRSGSRGRRGRRRRRRGEARRSAARTTSGVSAAFAPEATDDEVLAATGRRGSARRRSARAAVGGPRGRSPRPRGRPVASAPNASSPTAPTNAVAAPSRAAATAWLPPFPP